MLAANNPYVCTRAYELNGSPTPEWESPPLKVLWTHVKGWCFQSWLIVSLVEMPVPITSLRACPSASPDLRGPLAAASLCPWGCLLPCGGRWHPGTVLHNASRGWWTELGLTHLQGGTTLRYGLHFIPKVPAGLRLSDQEWSLLIKA